MALIRGTQFNDRLNGTANADVIEGFAGSDTIFGFAGNDTVRAGFGNDYVEGGDGNDVLYGDAGDDWLVGGRGIDTFFGGSGIDAADFLFDATGSSGGVSVDLSRTVASADGAYSVATVRTPAGNYQERLYSIEDVFGSVGNDAITGNAAGNVLLGEAGRDTLSGGSGDDTLDGGTGNDRLDGGTGFNDLVTGGGADTVVFRDDGRSDAVLDFHVDFDTLVFAGTGEPRGTTFTDLVWDGTIAVYDTGIDTILRYGGSEIILAGIDPFFLDDGNVLIA